MNLNVPPSTIAMSAVSLLCRTGPAPRAGLPALFHSRGYPVSAIAIDQAVDQAIERGLLKQAGEMVMSKLPIGWTVVDRDRSGDGWGGWVAQRGGERRDIAELIEGVTS